MSMVKSPKVKQICAICKAEILGTPITIPTLFDLQAFICEECDERFKTEQEKDEVIQFLIANGGYFGKLPRPKHLDLKTLLNALIKDLNGNADPMKVTLSLIHKALLYGFTPEEYIGEINALLRRPG